MEPALNAEARGPHLSGAFCGKAGQHNSTLSGRIDSFAQAMWQSHFSIDTIYSAEYTQVRIPRIALVRVSSLD